MSIGIRGFNPIWSEVDLTGKQFDSTFYLYVLQNTIPYLPAKVYHDVDLNVVWNYPIQFLANGTLPVDIYFVPNVIYRLEFRQNNGIDMPSQSDPLIYEVDNYIPNSGGNTPINTVALASTNQITNPQFSLIDFESPLTYTGTAASLPTPGLIEIGPGWFLQLAGTGSVTITQVPFNNLEPSDSNAPYALRLQLSGWTVDSVKLRQRFQQNGMLWAGKYVAAVLTAQIGANSVSVGPISGDIVDSASTFTQNVLSIPRLDETLTEYPGVGLLPLPSNTDIPPDAYIDYLITIPSNIDIYVTSVQLVVETQPIEPIFIQDSIDRQIDQTFHYFKPQLEFKPIPSLLTGWDFPLNPAQFGFAGNLTGSLAYIWDQTLAVMGSTASVAYTSNAITDSLQFTTGNANTESWYIAQYLTGAQAKKMLGTRLSVNVNAYKTNVGAAIGFKIYLFRGSSAAVVPVLPLKLGSLASNGDFTLNTTAGQGLNWSNIPRANIGSISGVAAGTLNVVTTNDEINNPENDYGFSGWEIIDPTQIADTDKFCIIVTFAYTSTATVAIINSISVVPGDIPTRPAPQTPDAVRRECQYYFRTSFLNSTTPAQAKGLHTGESLGLQTTTATQSSAGPIVRFDNQMRAYPIITTYNPVNANAFMQNETTVGTYTSITTNSTPQGFVCTGASNAGSSIGDFNAVHWTANAQLGIV